VKKKKEKKTILRKLTRVKKKVRKEKKKMELGKWNSGMDRKKSFFVFRLCWLMLCLSVIPLSA